MKGATKVEHPTMNPTSKPLAVTLDGKRYTLYFDLNTFSKFEEVSGKHFLDFLASMQEAAAVITAGKKKPKTSSKDQDESALAMFTFLRKLSIKDIRSFVYSAMHEYDREGEPYWPLTIGQMSRLITAGNMSEMVVLLMQGNSQNAPSSDDMGSSEESEKARPTIATGEETPVGGGDLFGPSDASILDSLTKS